MVVSELLPEILNLRPNLSPEILSETKARPHLALRQDDKTQQMKDPDVCENQRGNKNEVGVLGATMCRRG